MDTKKLLIIGHLPPPYHGNSIALEHIKSSDIIKKNFSLIFLNTRRDILINESNIGKLSLDKLFKDISHILILLRRLFVDRPDLVYITIAQTKWGYLRDGIFILLSKAFGKKCIVHLHGGYFRILYEKSSRLLQFWIRFTLKKVDNAIVLTESLKPLFNGLVDEKKTKVVPNCIDESLFLNSHEIRAKLGNITNRKNTVFKVLFLSNLYIFKGYFDILKAAAILKNKNLLIRFIFAGAWPDEEQKRTALEFINQNELSNIEILDFVAGDKKREVLKDSDIFILPTCYYEGLPISILEAMAAGLPIITTRHGGIPGIIEEGINGFFVPPKNPEAIAEKIYMLYFNPSLHAEIAKNNIEKAANNFRKEHYEKALLRIFCETL